MISKIPSKTNHYMILWAKFAAKVIVRIITTAFVCVCILIYGIWFSLQYVTSTEVLYCVCDIADGVFAGAVIMRLVLAVVWGEGGQGLHAWDHKQNVLLYNSAEGI